MRKRAPEHYVVDVVASTGTLRYVVDEVASTGTHVVFDVASTSTRCDGRHGRQRAGRPA
jgi:hypothetical protein